DLAHVGRARGAITPRLGRGAGSEHAVTFRPLRYRKVRIGPESCTPGGQQSVGTVEREEIVIQVRSGSRQGCRAGRGHGLPTSSASPPPPPRSHPRVLRSAPPPSARRPAPAR